MPNKFETGTSHFLDRFNLTRRFEENLERFFEDCGFKIMQFGQAAIVNNTWIKSRLRSIDSKSNLAALRVKFAPDYLVYKENDPKTLFFFDAKVSITPVFFGKHIERIRDNSNSPQLERSDIGDIEREAWLSYNKFYPDVAIVIACPYSKNVIMAEWVKNVKCLWCYKGSGPNGPIPWDCNVCPKNSNNESFGVVVNEFAGGSGTPHTNIDFGTFRTLPDFLLNEFAVDVDLDLYEYTMTEFVKTWPLNKPRGKISWKQYNGAIHALKTQEGLDWLKYRMEDTLFDTFDEFNEAWRHNNQK